MLTCIRCPNTKDFIKEITTHVKGMSLKSVGVQLRKKQKKQASRSGHDHMVETKEEGEEEEEEEEVEWVAEPEPGVLISLVSLPDGGNQIRKLRFSEELFDATEARRWWSDNCDKIIELYSIHLGHSPPTQAHCSDEYPTNSAQSHKTNHSMHTSHDSDESLHSSQLNQSSKSPVQESPMATGSRRIQGKVVGWMVEDEPGVLIKVLSSLNGSRELRRVELSEELFDTWEARRWSYNSGKFMERYNIHRARSPLTPLQSHDKQPINSAQAHEPDDSVETSHFSEESLHSSHGSLLSRTPTEEDPMTSNSGGIQRKVVAWMVEDEPGVLAIIRSLPDGSRELRHVEFSRERFGVVKAMVWWAENQSRLHKQYLLGQPRYHTFYSVWHSNEKIFIR